MSEGRYELKFLVSAKEREGVLASLGTEMTLDPHSEGRDYRVTSQYFDSQELTFFHEKLDGVRLRKKFRLRFYGDVPPGGARVGYMEIKHRRGEQILKERVRLSTDGALLLLDDAEALRDLGQCVAEQGASEGETERGALTIAAVERAARRLSLRATNVITYRREAWVSELDERLRLTFDHAVQVLPPQAYDARLAGIGRPLTPHGVCVMELKFDRRLPRWIRDVVVEEGVLLRRFSKYAEGILALRQRAEVLGD